MPNISVFKSRKEAPLYYYARAENARLCAFHLFHWDNKKTDYCKSCGYSGTPGVGFYEGYLRESAVALELIIKSNINILSEYHSGHGENRHGMPQHHRLPELWKHANLPNLSETDFLRLRVFRQILEWSGRYPTPRKEEIFLKEIKEIVYPDHPDFKDTKVKQGISLEWEHFDRIYVLARNKFFSIHSAHDITHD